MQVFTNWKPRYKNLSRYFIIDNSATEQKAICETFAHTDFLVEYYLCTVHLQRTLMRKLGKKELVTAKKHMSTAIYARTSLDVRLQFKKQLMLLPQNKARSTFRFILDILNQTGISKNQILTGCIKDTSRVCYCKIQPRMLLNHITDILSILRILK
jgi:predicted transcriptional regulator